MNVTLADKLAIISLILLTLKAACANWS